MGINYSGTSTFNNIDVNGTATAATFEVEGQLRDGDGNFGSAGQVYHPMELTLNGLLPIIQPILTILLLREVMSILD